MPEADHNQRREKDDDSSKRDLQKGEVSRLEVEAENRTKKIVDRIHIKILSRNERLASLSISKNESVRPPGRVLFLKDNRREFYGTREQKEIYAKTKTE